MITKDQWPLSMDRRYTITCSTAGPYLQLHLLGWKEENWLGWSSFYIFLQICLSQYWTIFIFDCSVSLSLCLSLSLSLSLFLSLSHSLNLLPKVIAHLDIAAPIDLWRRFWREVRFGLWRWSWSTMLQSIMFGRLTATADGKAFVFDSSVSPRFWQLVSFGPNV